MNSENMQTANSRLAIPLFAALAGLGLVAIVAGLIAMIAGGDRSGFTAGETSTEPEFELGSPAFGDLPTVPPAGATGEAPDIPRDAGDSGNPGDDFEPFDGQVLPPSAIRDLAQQSLDFSDRVTMQVGDEELTITRLSNGHCQFTGPSGSSIVIAPSGVPGAGPAGGVPVLAPDANGPFSGIRIDENGDVVPVLRGEETPDTLTFGFDDQGVRTLGLPGSDERLRITPDGSLALDQGTPRFGAAGGAVAPPDVRRDALQGQLDRFGTADLTVDDAPVEIKRHPDGTIEMIGPSGESTFLTPESVTPDGTRIQGESQTYAPSPGGPYSGFRVDDDGNVVPVPRGEETDDMFGFGFGPTGVRDLYLPGADGEALRISPNGASRDAERAPASGTGVDPGFGTDSPAAQDGQLNETFDPDPASEDSDRDLPWSTILILAGITLVALACLYGVWAWRRPGPIEHALEPDPSADLGPIVEQASRLFDTIVSPRQSILDAYSELESGLAAQELIRQQAESPRAFLTRTIGANPSAAAPLERLTDLFEMARFSDYDMTEDMRDDAIAAMSDIARAYGRVPELV